MKAYPTEALIVAELLLLLCRVLLVTSEVRSRVLVVELCTCH